MVGCVLHCFLSFFHLGRTLENAQDSSILSKYQLLTMTLYVSFYVIDFKHALISYGIIKNP